MPPVEIISQGTIFRDPFRYASHPHATIATDDDIVVVFNQTSRSKFIFHPPHDPGYRNYITRSPDYGKTWSAPQVVPHYGFSGTECASLTSLSNGTMLLNQWRFRWYPLALVRAALPEPVHFPEEFVRELILSGELDTGKDIAGAPEDFAPWARGHGDAWVHLSYDGGRSFLVSTELDTGYFHGGYGMRGALELSDGTLLLPLNDTPDYRTIFTLRSDDGGRSWHAPRLVARKNDHLFTEAAMALTPSGDILCLMREDTSRVMHSCHSSDGGMSWSMPEPTGIDGYPPHLLLLDDGRMLCTYGVRRPEFSICAVQSMDGGHSWTTTAPIHIRRKLLNRDLGYPVTVLLSDGSLFTVYYCQDQAGITGIEHTRWRL